MPPRPRNRIGNPVRDRLRLLRANHEPRVVPPGVAPPLLGHRPPAVPGGVVGPRLPHGVDVRPPLRPRYGQLGRFNVVFLFFNLPPEFTNDVQSYSLTTSGDAAAMMGELVDGDSEVSRFVHRYFGALSYGAFSCGVETPRSWAGGANGTPMIFQVGVDDAEDRKDWTAIIKAIVESNADEIWRASGSLSADGVRQIPSVVLIQNYAHKAAAVSIRHSFTRDGFDYHVEKATHIRWSVTRVMRDPTTGALDTSEPPLPSDNAEDLGFEYFDVLTHELSHNFAEFGDLYRATGCVGYWDLLGDAQRVGFMSEISSYVKSRADWPDAAWGPAPEVLEGPRVERRTIRMRPYSATGQAIKVVPDPVHQPHEYFLLEYRAALGDEAWRPDGGLGTLRYDAATETISTRWDRGEAGLLVFHVDERFGRMPYNLASRQSPLLDPEHASAIDSGTTAIINSEDVQNLDGPPTPSLFGPIGGVTSFTPVTMPSSGFHGGRRSGLSIVDVRIETAPGVDEPTSFADTELVFELEIDAAPGIGWETGPSDRGVAGRFTADADTTGMSIFMRSHDAATLLRHSEASWHCLCRNEERIGAWVLHPLDRELAVDLRGEGKDQIFVFNDARASVVDWNGTELECRHVQTEGLSFLSATTSQALAFRFRVGSAAGAARLESGVLVRTRDRLDLVWWYEPPRGRPGLRVLASHTGPLPHASGLTPWMLSPNDVLLRGRFTGLEDGTDELVVVSATPAAAQVQLRLLRWDLASRSLRVVEQTQISTNALGGARMSQWLCGDLDGDGLDELIARNAAGLAVLRWRVGNQPQSVVNASWPVPAYDYSADDTTKKYEAREFSAEAEDRLWVGAFMPERLDAGGNTVPARDGILVQRSRPSRTQLTILVLEETDEGPRLYTRYSIPGSSHWNALDMDLVEPPRVILGDFHRRGLDPGVFERDGQAADEHVRDYVADRVTDIFLHDSELTAMVCPNYVDTKPLDDENTWLPDFDLTWHRRESVMVLDRGDQQPSADLIAIEDQPSLRTLGRHSDPHWSYDLVLSDQGRPQESRRSGIILHDRESQRLVRLVPDDAGFLEVRSSIQVAHAFDLGAVGLFRGDFDDPCVMLYRKAGRVETWRVDGDGQLRLFRTQSGMPRDCELLVAAQLTSPFPRAQALFYDRERGTAALYQMGSNGGLSRVRGYSGWRRSWDLIVAGRITGGTRDDLLFHDRDTGDIKIFAIDDDGRLERRAHLRGQHRGWTGILVGTFSRRDGDDFRRDLLMYDDTRRSVQLFRFEDGELEPLGSRIFVGTGGWRALVRGNFADLGRDSLYVMRRG